jgi:lysylphosphatidylglycerol synthetase-like protein (DUF2156 family)
MFSSEQGRHHGRRSLLHGALAVGAALLVVLALRLAGEDLRIDARGTVRPVPAGAVAVAAVAGALAAAVLGRLARRSSRPRRTFLVAVAAGLALSSVPPVAAAATPATAGWLLVLHAVVAAVVVPPVARALPVGGDGPRPAAGTRERHATGSRR